MPPHVDAARSPSRWPSPTPARRSGARSGSPPRRGPASRALVEVADGDLDVELVEQRRVAARAHEAAHLVAVLHQALRQVAADEPARAGDEAGVVARRVDRLAAKRRPSPPAPRRARAGGAASPWRCRAPRPSSCSRRRGSRRAPRRARRGSCCASASESVSGGSSLITSFLPAAIVITPWSRCSGITISCGNRPSLARWIRRQFSARDARARRAAARSRSSARCRGPP